MIDSMKVDALRRAWENELGIPLTIRAVALWIAATLEAATPS